jgi:arsenate reductase (glutaredoxin)
MDVSVWFNPACGTCRTTQGILAERGVDAELFEYLHERPSRADIERVMGLLGTDDPRTIVRTKEPVYRELRLADAGRDQLLDAMAANPVLIERPIVIRGDRAVVARPADRVLELLDDEPADG